MTVVEKNTTNIKEIQGEKIDSIARIYQENYSVEGVILQFFKDNKSNNQRFYLAKAQLLSLYRRIGFHPEKKGLYVSEIEKVITLFKRGKI
ncbi:hypothetical protein LCGC14_0714010 [marine sediment metagenome]|uniref:Uncharacterized protein n=1 Tax=marine sediment metagenome TaxID=412755 RepID=A0A0F9SZU2_9ZZZZ